jgi:Na+-translocating ferredoxin:NAD+ oxidoreductase RNF subunit RnfB
MSEDKYKKAARAIIKAGTLPFPVNETLLEILQLLLTEEDLIFIDAFKRKSSQTMEELKKSSTLPEERLHLSIKSLAKKGFLFNQPNSEGIMVYRLMPILMVGAFEYIFMKKINYTEEEKKIAYLFEDYFHEISDFIQSNYDTITPIFEKMRPYDRTLSILDDNIDGEEIDIEINSSIEIPEEQIIPTQKVEELINKFEDIAVGRCFCRQHKDLLGQSCTQTELRENCFTFGKSARYVTEQGFGRLVSKQEALEIMKKSEVDGLVHKAFHPHSDIYREESSICNCCKDCCGTLEYWRMGLTALVNSTNYLSRINEDICTGCGICITKCPVDAIKLNNNDKAEVNEQYCIGCGVCAHFCPEHAISLLEGLRTVYVPPPRIK